MRNTVWLADDSDEQLLEIDLTNGTLRSRVTGAQLAAVGRFAGVGATPVGEAGSRRVDDLEAVAYDSTTDRLYVFSGPCCDSTVRPTAFRLVRPGPGEAFAPESHQPLDGLAARDFSGAGAVNGEVWGADGDALARYDFDSNRLVESLDIPGIDESIYGVTFNSAGTELWVSTSDRRAHRFHWPSLMPFPGQEFALGGLGILDARALELVGERLIIADGYDSYPSGSAQRFALSVFELFSAAPIPSFEFTPIAGLAPLDVTLRDQSTQGPTSWHWDFGDGTPPSTAQHPTHRFTDPGTFAITLTVRNGAGERSLTRHLVVGLASPQPPQPPPPLQPPPPAQPPPPPLNHDTGGLFVGVVPARLADTRAPGLTVDGAVSGRGELTGGTVLDVPVVNRGDVPGSGVVAVALNVTAVGATQPTYVTAWPTGHQQPDTSNLNVEGADPIANMVIVPVGHDGQISLFNRFGRVHLIVDVLGWIRDVPGFGPLNPARVLDTRPGGATVDGHHAGGGAAGAGGTIRVPVAGRAGVPASEARAVVVNLTAVAPTATTYLTLWPAGFGRPATSSLNTARGRTTANLAIVEMGHDGSIAVFNESGSTHVLIDVLGWFGAAPGDIGWHSVAPARLADTRAPGLTVDGQMSGGESIGGGPSLVVPILGRAGVPTHGVGSVAVNVTATGSTASSYVTVWPTGRSRPIASTLNLTPGSTTANMTIVPIGADGSITLYNEVSGAQLIVDIVGWFPTTI